MSFRNRLESVLAGLRGDPRVFDTTALEPFARRVDVLARPLASASDAELESRAQALRGSPMDIEEHRSAVFALVLEAARRALGLRAFPVQLIAGWVLCEGAIAEMQTGEGKTLAATFAAAEAALSGTRIHVWTANDYLARRDAEWMGPVYERLGFEPRWPASRSLRKRSEPRTTRISPTYPPTSPLRA